MWFFLIIVPLLIGTPQHITYTDYESRGECMKARVRAVKMITSVKKDKRMPYYLLTSCKKVGIKLIGGMNG